MEDSSEFLVLDPRDTLIFSGKPGAQSNTTLKIFNPSNTNGYFKVQLTCAKHYSVVPAKGMLKPSESLTMRIISKELPLDCEKHKFNIVSAAANTNVDANTFWRNRPSGNTASQKLSVRISSNENILHSDNAHVSKQPILNKEQLELYIRSAVENGQPFLSIEKQLFPNPTVVPKAVKQFVTKQYTEYLIEVLKHNFKDAVIAMVQQGNASVIGDFRENREKLTLQSQLWSAFLNAKQTTQLNNFRNLFTASGSDPEKAGQAIIASAKKYFDMCLALYVDEDAETAIRQLLVQWFKSGHMNKAVFDQWKSFKNQELSPRTLKAIPWKQLIGDDHYANQLEQILKRIMTDKFLHQKELYNILNIFGFEEPSINTSGMNKLSVTGRVMFLSDVKDKIEQTFKGDAKITEIRFDAKNVFNIDKNLENTQWHSKNVVIVADKVHVWGSCTIDVSGWGYYDQSAGKRRALDGQESGKNGADGKDGSAGHSSGNIVFLTEELLEGNLLTLILNGGKGQDGEDGGHGANGRDGCGVTQNDLDSLILKYSTLYWGGSSHFFNFTPTNTKELSRNVDTYNKYVKATFEDESGRVMHWSYAEDYSFWSTSTYDLYFLIKGTQGTAGGIGGANGVGGEGGNRGECTARKLYSGKELSIGKIQQNIGRSGEHGALGKPGRFGKNGNDMVFVDRSTISSGKKYIGSDGNMSIEFKYQMNQKASRTDGYEKWVNKRSSYYVHFDLQKIAEGAVMKMETQQRTDANRQSHSKTVCNASIIVSDVVAEFAQCFQQDDAVLAEACRAQERADEEEHDEDEEQQQETVAEEVNVLLECVDEDNNVLGRHGAGKKRSSWTKFFQRLKKYDKENNENIVELAFELFEHEISEEQLNEINLQIDQIVKDFKNAVKQGKWENSEYRLPQIQTLAGSIDQKMKEKRAQAALRSQKSALFDKYLNSVVKADHTLDASMTILIGVQPGREYICQFKETVIPKFFNQYKQLGVSTELLDAMYAAFDYLQQKHNVNLAPFDAGLQFDWCDEKAVKHHLEKTEASSLDKLQKALETDVQNLEVVFENFNEIIKADSTKALLKRFGLMPTSKIAKEAKQMDSEKFDANPDQPAEKSKGWLPNWRDHIPSYFSSKHGTACFIAKFYFQTRSILTFNRCLYTCNLLSNAKILHHGADQVLPNTLLNINDPNFAAFMGQRKRKPLDIESGDCEGLMRTHGIDAAAYRFLLAHESNINVRIYKAKRYATVELQENFNPSARGKLLLLSDHRKMYSLEPDMDYRSMAAARQGLTDTTKIPLPEAVNSSELLSIVNFFPNEYASIVSSWLRMFHAVNRPRALVLVSLLRNRFHLDSCQLSVVEFQAILNAYSHAAVLCQTNDDFLLKLAAVMQQHHILDAFLYVRIENAKKRRLNKDQGRDIASAIRSVDSPHLKALFATKLNEAQFNESVLLKLLTMLRYAVDRFQRLEKMTLTEWIDTSQRQKWSGISDLLKEFGAVGYYLAFLDNRNRPEEPMLRSCLQGFSSTRVLIPEKVIARIAYLIAYGEVEVDQTYLNRLKQLLGLISKNYSHYLPVEQQKDAGTQHSGYPLLMNERNQNDLLGQVKQRHNETYEPIFPTGERTIDKLKTLIVGQHDDNKRKEERRTEIINLATQLASKQNKNVQIINQIDAVIANVFPKAKGPKISLRDTQKMAVLIAAESKKNTLLQVNTGEGKTLLIATLAILRAKQNKKVDVITSSPVLAARDVEKMQPLFKAFNITASHNCEEQINARKSAYKSQIVYGDMQHFQRDFLLHNFYKKNIFGDRKRECVIVDEVDNMLLDNGNNMLYLSHTVAGMESLMSLFVFLHRAVNVPLHGEEQNTQFDTVTIRKQVLADMIGCVDKQSLEKLCPDTNMGVNRVWQKFIETNVIDRDGLLRIQSEKELPANFLQTLETIVAKNIAVKVKYYICVILHRERHIEVPRYLHPFVLNHLDMFIDNTKRAMFMHHNDEYVIDVNHKNASSDLNPRVTIIDKNTGVDLTTSQWSEGLHQAVQLKHGCRLSSVSLKAIFVSNVGYFKGYEHINGLSGTLGSIEESKTLVSLYNADLVRIPTWKPKNFYEHVPVVAANEALWLQNIYEEVKDQVIARRSVLIVCNSISQVNAVQRGLERLHRLEKHAVPGKGKFAQLVRKHFMRGDSWKRVLINKVMTQCFDNLIVYRRDHDEFDLSGAKALPFGRLIIATNLAGRGTDIELSEELQQAGGLHVIVAFLPENCRIEEQAFGRASRCGHPGSGQIIALIEDDKRIDASEAPTIFQLKEFRDNAEVHRLQSLKQRYDYHTAVEESCLNKFWEHSSRALESAQSTENIADVNALPTPMQVVYFSLLDEWALWLDEKAPLIQQCARNCSDDDKRAIIQSVEQFLKSHPLTNVQTATEWIKSPQPLLTLGLIELNNSKTSEAKSIFDRVLAEFPEYAAEAYYYIGVIEQRITRQIYGKLSFSTAFQPDTWKQWLIGTEERNIVEAINAFHESRRHFSLRKYHRDELATTVARLQRANESIISTNGFTDQHREYVAVHDAIVGNIDKFLGKPIQSTDLRHGDRDELDAIVLRDALQDFGITTKIVLSSKVHEDQIEYICSRHPISRKDLLDKFEGLRKSDGLAFESDGRPELEAFELRRLFKLPSRLEFWNELRELGVFLKESKYFTTSLSGTIGDLTPVDSSTFDKIQSVRLQFTDVPLDSVKIFKFDDVIKTKKNNSNLHQLKTLLENGTIATEFVAEMDVKKLLNLNVYMRNFEGFKLAELEEHLGVDQDTANWILSTYIKDEIIALGEDGIYELMKNQYTNNSLPDALRIALEKFFADRFAYTYSLDALRHSFIQPSKSSTTPRFIYLPTNPYEDLLADMLKCGIAMPSRVSLAIPRKIDSDYNVAVQAIEYMSDFNQIKDVIEANRPTIGDADCKLVDTHKYVISNGTGANQELKNFISNGLKQVAIVEENTSWLWLLAIGALLLIVVAVVAVATFGWSLIVIGLVVAACVLAAYAIYKIGSYAHYRATRLLAKRIATNATTEDFEFNFLREFHATTVDEEIRKEEQNTLLKKVHDGINDLADKLNRWLVDEVEFAMCLDEHLPEKWSNMINLPLEVIQQKYSKAYEVLMNVTPVAADRSIKSQDVTEEIRFITESYLAKVESQLYATLELEIIKKPAQRKPEILATTLDGLKEQMNCVGSDVLKRIVKTTCNTFEANLSDEALKFNLDLTDTKLFQMFEFDISENTLLEIWLDSLQNRYAELISREISRTFREPLLRRFAAYITNSTVSRKESSIGQKVLDSDMAEKREHQTLEKLIEAKSQVEFLEREVQEVCTESWDVRRDKSVLHYMIINRYAFPVSAAPSVEKATQKLLSKTMPNFSGFQLKLLDKERKTVYGERRENTASTLQLTLTLHKEQFHVARKSLSKGDEIGTPSFLYEGLCGASEQFGLIFHTADEFITELADSLLSS